MPKLGKFTSEEAKVSFLRAYDAVAVKWPVPSTQIDVETSFGTTRVRKSGNGAGAPIVLLPGIGGNGQVWWRFIAELSRGRVVYTPDVIGWAGHCTQTAPLRDTEDIATWMAETLDGLGVDRVHLAGNSLGAWLATAIAVHRSDRLATLTMLEPSASTFAKPRPSLLFRFLMAGMRPTPERMRKFNNWLMPGFELDDEEFALARATTKFRPGMPWDRPFTDEQLALITVPTLVLFGAETVVNDLEHTADRARRQIRSAEVEIYPGVGHDLLWANPEQIIPRYLTFVGNHDQIHA
ncbi:alpha/beta hydrolase [Nocardia farcinica]|uniref:alpha/beta fold hydrolase n=1 Tax=Nocardia farcinica TaxID=37329 RepID=UPI001895D253|nr:alpha/beta hydrolase [Nocardia farcinica]MBF6257218.1 alpha/beta hydrolase [Nocardia farcinica]MBF6417247.1 alpha/beta hydrolase [Nocardia farcinica]MBF6432088.1 alpha/beta hydrolase [Nocardia farcinica]MBF6502588.1 alpha/beta hydrolase [Nocardia farcinica]MBF6524050.1 alpha/beta hydrolase [Nocardia farcinica]